MPASQARSGTTTKHASRPAQSPTRNLVVGIDAKVKHELKVAAAKRGLTMTSLVEQLVREYLDLEAA